jgi:L-alanine-DL-glutamate epimerase-like enolase superfamily enzyme
MWKAGDILFDATIGPDKGTVTLSKRSGLGLEPKWDALKEYQK